MQVHNDTLTYVQIFYLKKYSLSLDFVQEIERTNLAGNTYKY